MKKTILRFLMCCVAALTLISITAFADTNEPKTASDETINVIRLLEIANGDNEGNMNYDNDVTRAEFLKMAINASSSKETAANIKLGISLFPDVKNSHWAAGYISVAINNGLVTGYIDGTFKPSNPVTLEEAATIVLRLLGYTNADLVGTYPTAQLQKYSDLELDNNINAVRGQKLSREECMILIYNALSAKTKQGTIYCTSLGYTTNSEGKLDYSALLEEKLDGPIIITDTSETISYKTFTENDTTEYYLNNSPSTREEIKSGDVAYCSSVINSVYLYRKTATGILEGVNGSSVSLSGKNYTIASASAKDMLSFGGKFSETKSFITLILGINDGIVDVTEGDKDKIGENDDNSSILSMIEQTISKPIYIKDDEAAAGWSNKIPFSTEDCPVYLNGSLVTSPTILTNDVIYYSKAFSSIWVYRKTISGSIETISPAGSPTSVTLSGKTYSIASSDAAYDLSIYGAYEVGDKATLILGMNDECVAVCDTKNTYSILYGVITAKGEKEYTDKNGDKYTADYITVTDTTATSHTYEYKNRHLAVGDAVKVSVSDTISMTEQSSSLGRGQISIICNALKNGLFTDDCEIIDTRDSDVIKINPERITGVEIDSDLFKYSTIVLYCDYTSDGYISKLILKNFTGDLDEYGVVVKSSNSGIVYMTDRIEKNLSMDTPCKSGPAKLKKENGSITSASTLNGVIEDIEQVSSYAVYDEDDNEYLVADNVKVFIKNTASYDYSSISEISGGDYNLKAYFNKLPSLGGRIRVIIATRN